MVAAGTGRGGLALAAGKIYFLVIGLVQQVLLKGVLGLGGYGAYSTAQSIASITYNPVVQTSIQGVSRELSSAAEGERPRALRTLLGWHAVMALGLALLFLALGPVAASLLGAPHLGRTIRILALVLLAYGLYAPLVGALNGLRRFVAQAVIDVIAATLRTGGLLGGAYLGVHTNAGEMAGVEGAALGFSGMSLVIVGAGLWLAGAGERGAASTLDRARYLRFIAPVLLGQLLLNLLFQADALVLRRLGALAAEQAGLGAVAADPLVGAYRAAQLFCFLPYQLLMSVTFILFPLLASARAAGDEAAVRLYVASGVRLATLVTSVMVAALLAVPGGLVALVYGPDAAALAAPAMRVMALGLGSFAVLGVMTSALNGLGAPKPALLVTAAAVGLVVGLTWLMGSSTGLGASLLEQTARGASIGLVLATGLGGLLLRRTAGASLPLLTLGRALGASLAAGLGIGALLTGGSGHGSPATTLLGAALAPLATVVLLVASRELRMSDWQGLRRLFRRGG